MPSPLVTTEHAACWALLGPAPSIVCNFALLKASPDCLFKYRIPCSPAGTENYVAWMSPLAAGRPCWLQWSPILSTSGSTCSSCLSSAGVWLAQVMSTCLIRPWSFLASSDCPKATVVKADNGRMSCSSGDQHCAVHQLLHTVLEDAGEQHADALSCAHSAIQRRSQAAPQGAALMIRLPHLCMEDSLPVPVFPPSLQSHQRQWTHHLLLKIDRLCPWSESCEKRSMSLLE